MILLKSSLLKMLLLTLIVRLLVSSIKDGSIKHDVNIKFDDYIENVYPFTLELTQRSLVARYIKNNGYNVDFDNYHMI